MAKKAIVNRDFGAEKEAVRQLGARIGYGNMMELAQECWREMLVQHGTAGGEFSLGPCVALVGKSHLGINDVKRALTKPPSKRSKRRG